MAVIIISVVPNTIKFFAIWLAITAGAPKKSPSIIKIKKLKSWCAKRALPSIKPISESLTATVICIAAAKRALKSIPPMAESLALLVCPNRSFPEVAKKLTTIITSRLSVIGIRKLCRILVLVSLLTKESNVFLAICSVVSTEEGAGNIVKIRKKITKLIRAEIVHVGIVNSKNFKNPVNLPMTYTTKRTPLTASIWFARGCCQAFAINIQKRNTKKTKVISASARFDLILGSCTIVNKTPLG